MRQDKVHRLNLYILFGVVCCLGLLETSTYTFPAPFLTLFLRESGYDLSVSGVVFACYGVGSVISFHFPGLLVRRIGDKAVILGSTTLLVLSLVFPAVRPDPIVLGTCRVLQGIAAIFMWAAAVNFATRFSHETKQRSSEMGVSFLFSVSPLGTSLGPVLGTAFSALWGPRYAYPALAVVALVFLLVAAVLISIDSVLSRVAKGTAVKNDDMSLAEGHGFIELREVRRPQLGDVEEAVGNSEKKDGDQPVGNGMGYAKGSPGEGPGDKAATLISQTSADVDVVPEKLTSGDDPKLTEATASETASLMTVLRIRGVVICGIAGGLAGLNLCWLEPVLALVLYTDENVTQHTARTQAALYFTVLSLSMFISAIPVGRVSSSMKGDRWVLILIGAVLSTATSSVFPLLSVWPQVNATAVAYGLVFNLLFVPMFAQLDKATRKVLGRECSEGFSIVMWIHFLGMLSGPLFASIITHRLSFNAACYFMAGSHVLFMPLLVYMIVVQQEG